MNHKILDCIGDLFTCGFRMIAEIKCSQGGHYFTNELLRKVFNNKITSEFWKLKKKSSTYLYSKEPA